MRRFAAIAQVLLLAMLTQIASASSFDELLRFMERSGLALRDGGSPDDVAVDAVLRQIDPGYRFIEDGEPPPASPTNQVERVPLEMWSARLAYVSPGRLDPAGVALLTNSLARIEWGQLDGLILDLRACTGGSLDDAVVVASRFVPNGTDLAAQTICHDPRTASRTRIWRSGGPPHDGVDYRCAVLTDALTTGGGEALAAMLQPFAPFLVVGQPTGGTLAARQQLPFGKGIELAISTADLQIGTRCYRPGDAVDPDLLVDPTATYRGTQRRVLIPLDRDRSAEALNDQTLMEHVGDDATLGKAIDILLAMRAISVPVSWSSPACGNGVVTEQHAGRPADVAPGESL